MSRYTGPVCRLCRREGQKLYLKGDKCYTDKCPMSKKLYTRTTWAFQKEINRIWIAVERKAKFVDFMEFKNLK